MLRFGLFRRRHELLHGLLLHGLHHEVLTILELFRRLHELRRHESRPIHWHSLLDGRWLLHYDHWLPIHWHNLLDARWLLHYEHWLPTLPAANIAHVVSRRQLIHNLSPPFGKR